MQNINRVFFRFIFTVSLALPLHGAGIAGSFPHEELRERLFTGGRPIGQPLSLKQPDVRIVRVDSRHEADSLFFGLCLGCRVTRRMYKGDEWFTCQLPPHYGGTLYYTHRPLRGWRVVGIVYIRSPMLNKWGFTEIRFVETIKTKKR